MNQAGRMLSQYSDLYSNNQARELLAATSTTPIPQSNDLRKESHGMNISQQVVRTVGDHYGLKNNQVS